MKIKNNIEIRDGKWHWPIDDESCWNYMLTHPDLPIKISELVPNKNIVVQAGGNMGYYVKQYAALFDIVYTFEPDPVNFYCLNLNIPETNVIKIQSCLGNDHNCVSLKVKSRNRGKNHIQGQGHIPTLKIDDLNLPGCDLIHLDIEGYELFALQGGLQTIVKYRPVVAVEYFSRCYERYNYNLEDLEKFLFNLGYKLSIEFEEERVYKIS